MDEVAGRSGKNGCSVYRMAWSKDMHRNALAIKNIQFAIGE